METDGGQAFGSPGMQPRWSWSSKSGVGTALGASSRVWFTLSHGIFNEIYYPRLDEACTRDLGLIVTDGKDFFSEEKRDTDSEVAFMARGVPAYRLTNTCRKKRYRVEKQVLCDPRRDTVLQQTRFVPLSGELEQYHLFLLLSPHIRNRGYGNTAWVGEYKGRTMLFAEREGTALALACSAAFGSCSAGYVGSSDGWQDIRQHGRMEWGFARAEDGNVALSAEVELAACGGEFLLALGFGRNGAEAGLNALSSLEGGFQRAAAEYIEGWKAWQGGLRELRAESDRGEDLYPVSMAVLRTHEAKRFGGGVIASLSIPWGASKGDDDLGGYHLVWPRDLAEVAGALLAGGAGRDALRVIEYLQATQEADGHWAQNMWIDGSPYWPGIQMDETAFPILLLDLARRERLIDGEGLRRYWPMARRAAGYLYRNGPVSQQDRWEEDPGYSPFTLAAEIAALLVAAEMAEEAGESGPARFLRETADAWNQNVERWTYVQETPLAIEAGVEGYYVRIGPPDTSDAASPQGGFVTIKNRPPGQSYEPAQQIVSTDALALVRFGLRAPDDPRMLNTVRMIDSLLKVDTPFGPTWHRYNDDGYGEHQDGAPFDGTGIGRGWPLLTGERAHYALAAGHVEEARELLKTMASLANQGGMIPEQVWDSADIPDRELYCGRPSGSAMPLAWAHAEYIKLRRSIADGVVYDTPPQTVERYVRRRIAAGFSPWRYNHKCASIPAGLKLRLEVPGSARVHWTTDDWAHAQDQQTEDSGLGLHVADLDCAGLAEGSRVTFTFHWNESQAWEGHDYTVAVGR
jgi:glucoamylase